MSRAGPPLAALHAADAAPPRTAWIVGEALRSFGAGELVSSRREAAIS